MLVYYRRLELHHCIAHAFKFERALPTHKVAVQPFVIFVLTFKASNAHNRSLATDNLIKGSVLSQQKQRLSL